MYLEKQRRILKLIEEGRYLANKNGLIFSTGKYGPTLLGQRVNSSGYYLVTLSRAPDRIDCGAHQFCYLYFHGTYPVDKQINHKDGNKLNNSITNLEVLTASENQLHASRNGLFRDQQGTKNSISKLTEAKVLYIRRAYGRPGVTLGDLAQKFNVSKATINNVILRKTWRHI